MRGGKAGRSFDLAVEAVLRRPLVDGVEQPVHLEIGERALVAQRTGELRLAVPDPGETADQLHADGAERVEVERHALGRAHKLHGRDAPRAGDVVDLVVALMMHAGMFHPPLDVLAAIHAGRADVLAHRKA